MLRTSLSSKSVARNFPLKCFRLKDYYYPNPMGCLFSTLAGKISPRYNFEQIISDTDATMRNIEQRNTRGNPKRVAQLYQKRSEINMESTTLRRERNQLSKSYAKSSKEQQRQRAQEIKERLREVELELRQIQSDLDSEADIIPNITHPDVPIGDESHAKLIATHGSRPSFNFVPKSHLEIGKALDIFDFDAAAAIAGSKFCILKNQGVFLELALIRWCMDQLSKKFGFVAIAPPDIAHKDIVHACGFKPREGEASQIYNLSDTEFSLIGTSEIPLMALHAHSIVHDCELPLRYAAFSHCFRHEAGSARASVKGLYRLHQFSKVEMGIICTPEQSNTMLQELLEIETELYTNLELHFRVLEMPTAELGASAYRKYDIEAWMPGRQLHDETGLEDPANLDPSQLGAFGEVSSASNCTDYQSRRLNIRYRQDNKNQFVHTLNATACATSRIMLSILEQHQQEDGSVYIPQCLQPYMGGVTHIRPIEKDTTG